VITPKREVLCSPESVLQQIQQKRWVDVLKKDMTPDHIHHKHFQAVSSGSIGDKHYVQVQTWMTFYLLPVQFDTAEAADAFLQQVASAYQFKPARGAPAKVQP